MINLCPYCQELLVEEEDNTLLYCENSECRVVAIQLYETGDGIIKREREE